MLIKEAAGGVSVVSLDNVLTNSRVADEMR